MIAASAIRSQWLGRTRRPAEVATLNIDIDSFRRGRGNRRAVVQPSAWKPQPQRDWQTKNVRGDAFRSKPQPAGPDAMAGGCDRTKTSAPRPASQSAALRGVP